MPEPNQDIIRYTRCDEVVDNTVDEQKASHKLREAPLCAICLSREVPGNTDRIVFTEHGVRRHKADSAQWGKYDD